MEENFKDWKKALDTFQTNVEKSLEEIRRSKAEMQQLKREMVDTFSKGHYFRDEERIIISAPEIIIGNVNKDGTLKTGAPSEVIIRSNTIRQEGVGNEHGMFGKVITKASQIQNVCADPGIDGKEAVAGMDSSFTVQAQGIMLKSEETEGTFAEDTFTSNGSIILRADRNISLDAMMPCEQVAEKLEETIKAKKETAKQLQEAAKSRKKYTDELFEHLETLSNSGTELYENDETTRTNYLDLDLLHEAIKETSDDLCHSLNECVATLSSLAEINRQVKSLEEKKKKIDGYKDNYKKENTGASVNIRAEHTSIASVDGDYNLRDNAGAGLDIQAPNVSIHALDDKGSTMKDSSFTLQTQDIKLTTMNPKITDEKTADYPAEGSILFTSKDITMEAVDYEYKDEKTTEKALTKDGSIKMRAETLQMGSNDTEGKASGSFSVNSKNITLKSVDVDKEKRTDKELAKESSMLLLSDKMYMGSKDKKSQSAALQISSDKVGIFAKTTAEIQQNDGKATVQLDGGNVALGGSKAEVYGETTVNGKTTFKGEVTAPKATIDNLEAKTSLKTPHISDGIAVPAAGASGSLSAKLKEEEIQDKE